MSVQFVAYIDESGDTGLSDVKSPQKPHGASEWLVLSCFLVRAENDNLCVSWVKDILSRFKNVQTPTIHFSTLLPIKQRIACEVIAQKPARYFVVASNKRNIEDYVNRRAAAASGHTGTAWLYWWLSRLLLERVTEFCEGYVPKEEIGKQKLRIVFSRRGRLKYADFDRYLTRIWWQSTLKSLHNNVGDLRWSVIDFEEVFAYGHKTRAGLQLADIGAGAFFQALEQNRPANCDPTCAKALDRIMARSASGAVLGFGLKTMPEISEMGLTPEQLAIFQHYGYSDQRW